MFSIKLKQVAGVTLIVGTALVLLSGWYLSSLGRIWLLQSQTHAKLVSEAIHHRAFDVVLAGGDPLLTLPADGGLQSILAASVYADNVISASIVDTRGRVIAHSDPDKIGEQAPAFDDLQVLLRNGPAAQARAIYTKGGKFLEFRTPLLLGGTDFGSVRVGISTLLLRDQLALQMKTPLITTALAILLASLAAMILAQVTVRPIHVLSTRLARLGRGELDGSVEFSEDGELAELGDSLRAVTARLAADRSELAGQRATLESVVQNLEDAVALFSPTGTLLFANPAMRLVLSGSEGGLGEVLPTKHPYRLAVETTFATGLPLTPTTVRIPGGGERLLLAHPVADTGGQLLGVLLLARNLTYLTQVESTLSYSRKLAALGRLSAGIAHEVKNPLNATMIHLELLKMQLGDAPGALEHVAVIAAQVRRLDEVVQGFLKFTRPEDLQLQPVDIGPLIEDIMPVIATEANARQVEVRREFPAWLPPASADSSLLQQAFLNLALNACQAMPNGGRLRIAGSITPDRRIQVTFEDTGLGMPPEHLDKIFDLYFTTREDGSGIGLSLVYRTVQLLDGEIEVESVPGRGTTFRILLREAPVSSGWSRDAGILGLREEASFAADGSASGS